MIIESLNDRLDRIESSIKEIRDSLGKIKSPDINKKEVTEMLGTSLQKHKPAKVDVDVKKEIESIVTKDFVNQLYRGQ
jgi:hypothetical protein